MEEPWADLNEWRIDSSDLAKSTSSPTRKLIEQAKMDNNPDLPLISLTLGDPTVLSELSKPSAAIEAVELCVKDKQFDSYQSSFGSEAARSAVTKYISRKDLAYDPKDIVLTNGATQALDLCFTVLANPGQNILIPKPGYSAFKPHIEALGAQAKYYNLLVSLIYV